MKRYTEIAAISKSLIESGGTNDKILKIMLHSLIEIG